MTIVFKTARDGIVYVMFLIDLYFRKEKNTSKRFEIFNEVRKEYKRFKSVGSH